MAPIPAGPGGDRGTYGVTDSIIMFENSKNKDEAWKFLDFLFTTEQRIKFTKARASCRSTRRRRTDPYFAENADLKVFTALLPNARFAPVITGWEEIARLDLGRPAEDLSRRGPRSSRR